MATEEIQSPQNPKNPSKGSVLVEDGGNRDNIISPRFRSVAAMAGWDEEAILLASLVVEDTPERESKRKKRVNLQFKTPPMSSRRKRRARRPSPASIPSAVLNLDDEEAVGEAENDTKKTESKMDVIEETKKGEEGPDALPPQASAVSSSGSALPCLDRLKEELSCAICLEICFEPSTTPCGHSFCKKCLKSAADKCGRRCPKCRELIGNGRSCTVNTVLWNTIQLLFPQEVEARKSAGAINRSESEPRSIEKNNCTIRHRSTRTSGVMGRDVSVRRRRGAPSQAEDAALAFRLQREEFAGVFRGTQEQLRTPHGISSARANLRTMASRAINLRIRGQPM